MFITNKKIFKIVLVFFCFCVFVLFSIIKHFSSLPKVIFFDVGQGDASLILTTHGQSILIDGGPDHTVVQKLGKYLPWWDKTIDLVILSHPDADHLTGFLEVIQRYRVHTILETGVVHKTPESREWRSVAQMASQHILNSVQTKNIILDNAPMQILWPKKNMWNQNVESVNNSSVVVRIEVGKQSFLFTGDLESDAQENLLDQDIQSDVLKFPHHGSSDSLNFHFLKKVDPKIAVIQVGKNRFGHPSGRVLKALEKDNIEVFTTQISGDIVFSGNDFPTLTK